MRLQIDPEVFPVKAIFIPAQLLCVLLLSFCLTGCRKEPLETSGSAPETIESEIEPKGVYHKLTPEEAYDMMQAGGITVVDVRMKAEYDGGHIADAVLVPNETISDTSPPELPDKTATLLIYCRSGRRRS